MPSIISASTASNTALNLSADTSGVLEIRTGSSPTTAMTIDGSQNVGIGTTSPTSFGSYKFLTIQGANTSNGGALELRNSDNTLNGQIYVGNSTMVIQATTNHPLLFNVNGPERMRITSAGNVGIGTIAPATPLQVNGTITATSVNTNNTFGFKNRIINGAFMIDQRNAGASYVPTNSAVIYGPDRWITFSLGAAVASAQRINNSGVTGFPFAFRQTGASGNTYAAFVQRIESANCLDLVGQQVTVSLFVATSNSSNVRIGIEYAGSTDNFNTPTVVQQQTIATTSTLTRYSVTFNALPSQVANGIQLDIEAASGIGAGVTFTITGVQLEVGSTATSFDYRPYGTELQLCQRYLPAWTAPGSAEGLIAAGGCANTTVGAFTVIYPVTTRVPPTGVSVTNATHLSTWFTTSVGVGTGISFAGRATTQACQINLTTSGLTTGAAASLGFNSNATSSSVFLLTGCEL